MRWLIGIGILAIAFCLVPFFKMIAEQLMKARQTHAISSLRQIGLALFQFESDYGKFPDGVTASEIKRKTGSALTLSDRTSNDVFVQTLVAGVSPSELPFDSFSDSTRDPDGDWSSDATALQHGETGFAFIPGLSPKDNPAFPIVFGPVIPGTKTVDAKSFGGKAVVLKLDNSVTSLPIDSSGKIIYDGMDLLDPRQPFWHGKAPDVKWPK
ncbi:MAG: DUF1559 domain-containing protein [Luteolibacter sp.]